ncbi:MAG: Gfo/Idh/MocA family oxidoreductase [Candidatus Nitrosocaldus sp.]
MGSLDVGIIGMGKMGILHAGILAALDGVRVTAAAEKDDTVRNYLKGILHDINVYDDYTKMLAKEDLNLVYITTPVSLHAMMIKECIKHGTNFFVEKPLAVNMQECIEICRLASNGVVSAVGFSKRFTDTFVKAREIIASNILGELIYVKGTMYLTQVFASGKGWRFKRSESGGGVMLELASHLVDMLQWYFGTVKSVASITRGYYSSEVEDFAHAMLRFENGLTGYLDASWSVRNYRLPEMSIEVHGSNGTMLVNDDYIRITLDDASKASSVDGLSIGEGLTTIYKQDLFKGVPIDIGGVEYTREDMHVVECVKERRQSMINVFEAAKVQAVIDAIYNSAKSNAWLEVNYYNGQ